MMDKNKTPYNKERKTRFSTTLWLASRSGSCFWMSNCLSCKSWHAPTLRRFFEYPLSMCTLSDLQKWNDSAGKTQVELIILFLWIFTYFLKLFWSSEFIDAGKQCKIMDKELDWEKRAIALSCGIWLNKSLSLFLLSTFLVLSLDSEACGQVLSINVSIQVLAQ